MENKKEIDYSKYENMQEPEKGAIDYSKYENMKSPDSSSAVSRPKENNIKAFNNSMGQGIAGQLGQATESGGKDILGGALSGAKGVYQNLPGSLLSTLLDKIMPEGTNPLAMLNKPINNAVNNFDPYKAVGTENKSILTPGGLLQAAGEFGGLGGPVRSIAKAIPHLTQRGASRNLNKARDLAKGRDIDKLNIDPELINDTRQFFPNTVPNRKAIDEAHTGDYNKLFDLQSDLFSHSSDYAKSLFSKAERQHGKAGLETRNRLLDEIHDNLQSQGHHDISNLLKQGQNDYRRYMEFKPYRNALALGGLSAAGLSIPNNPIAKILKGFLFPSNQ